MNTLYLVRISSGEMETYRTPIEKVEFIDDIIEHENYLQINGRAYLRGADEWKNYFKTESEAIAFKNSVIESDINFYQNKINKLRGMIC